VGKIGWTAVLLASFALAAPDARAAEPAIGIGEVSVAGAPAAGEVDDATLRAIVEEAVGAIDSSRLPRGRAAVLSVSIVRLESRSEPLEVSCLVSATLRDRRGAVFAVLQGSARGQDEPQRRRSLQRAILRAAVTSALARVPEAMRSRPR
jgi:hypothetical protein